nr:hypothetical protein [Panacagrimonas sp.]
MADLSRARSRKEIQRKGAKDAKKHQGCEGPEIEENVPLAIALFPLRPLRLCVERFC